MDFNVFYKRSFSLRLEDKTPLWRSVLFARRISTQNYRVISITENFVVDLRDFHLLLPQNANGSLLPARYARHSQ